MEMDRYSLWAYLEAELPKYKVKAVCRLAGVPYGTYRFAKYDGHVPREDYNFALYEAIQRIKKMPLEKAKEYVNMTRASEETGVSYGKIARWSQGTIGLKNLDKIRLTNWIRG